MTIFNLLVISATYLYSLSQVLRYYLFIQTEGFCAADIVLISIITMMTITDIISVKLCYKYIRYRKHTEYISINKL